MSQDNQKMGQNCEKFAQHGPKTPLKRSSFILLTVSAYPCQQTILVRKVNERAFWAQDLTRWGEDPRALFTLRISRRGHLAAGSQEAQMRGEFCALQALMARLHRGNWKGRGTEICCPVFHIWGGAKSFYST